MAPADRLGSSGIGVAGGNDPIAGADDVAAAVDRARAAATWWAGLGFAGRRTRLLRFCSILANRMPEIADLLRRECGKPVVDGEIETAHSFPTSPGRPQRTPGAGAAAMVQPQGRGAGNLARDTLAEVTAAAERGVQRIRSTPSLAFSFLRHCGLSLW